MKIAGHEYTIIFKPLDEPGQIGEHSKRECLITIDPNLDEAVTKETLLHEWLHAILSHHGIYADEDGLIPAEVSFDTIANELFRTGMVEHIIDQFTLNEINQK